MLAYHNDPLIKEEYVKRARFHKDNRHYVQNATYFQNGKGTAIGCLAESNIDVVTKLQEAINLPPALIYMLEEIFDCLPEGRYEGWAEEFLKTLPVGAELQGVTHTFLRWLLTEEIARRFDANAFTEIGKILKRVAKLHARSVDDEEKVSVEEWEDMLRVTSRLSSSISHKASYSNSTEDINAARVGYLLNYAVRYNITPRSASSIITCAGKCGVSYEVMAEELLSILRGLNSQ